MNKHVAAIGAFVTTLALATGGIAYAVGAPARDAASEDRPRLEAASVLADEGDVIPERGGFSLAHESAPTAGSPLTMIAAPVDAALEVTLDQSSIEQYWFWASGVRVTATGLAPGENARVSVTFASGTTKRWAAVTADADGVVQTSVRTLDVDPENLRPEAGLARISVESASGASGAAFLDIVVDPREVLQVSAEPGTITRDAFLDESVVVRATGFIPLEKVYFNLGSPDYSFQAVGRDEGLHADEDGVFEYVLQATTVNSQVGAYVLSIQSESNLSGVGSLIVTEGAPHVENKTVTLASSTITLADFSSSTGLPIVLSGFLPFDSYSLDLVSPRGVEIDLGFARSDGEGRDTNAVLATFDAPIGTYTLVVRSTTTGDYARAVFEVIDPDGPPAPTVSLTPQTIAAADLADPVQGVALIGTGLTPGAFVRTSIVDAAGNRQPLLVGADAYGRVDDAGALRIALVTLEVLPAGSYAATVQSGGGATAFQLRFALEVTGVMVPSTEPNTQPAPMLPSEPPAPTAPTPGASTPVPAPETVDLSVLPPAGGDILDEGFDGDVGIVPAPVAPQPVNQ